MNREQTNKTNYTPRALSYLLTAVLFCLGLVIFELLVLPKTAISLGIPAKHIAAGEFTGFLISITLIVLSKILLAALISVALASGYLFRSVVAVLIAGVVFLEYGYYNALGSFATPAEIEAAYYSTNFGIVSNSIYEYFPPLALLPIALLVSIFVFYPRSESTNRLIPVPFVLLTILFFTASAYFTSNTYYVTSVEHGLRSAISMPVHWYAGSINRPPRRILYSTPRESVSYKSDKRPANSIVFIVDESVLSNRLSINGYHTETTPVFKNLEAKGRLLNWGTAVSGTTCSVTSNALLLTGLNELPDKDFRVLKMPTIFQYAKAMNYKTHMYDGQVSSFWNGRPSDLADIDKRVTTLDLKTKDPAENDAEIARLVRRVVEGSTGNFIWINKYGLHQSHIRSYPVRGKDESEKYDNALRANLDSFLSQLTNGTPNPTYFIYTSDHGRNFDKKLSPATHCSNTRAEASVPLVLFTGGKKAPEADTNFKASHSNIFATLLDLMSYPENARKLNYSKSLLNATSNDSTPRFFFVGDLAGGENTQKIRFDE